MYITFAAGKWFQKSSEEEEETLKTSNPVPSVQTVQVEVHRSKQEEETPREGRFKLIVLFQGTDLV